MFIDIHIHTSGYSKCSIMGLNDAITQARKIGLDGICITDHESMGIKDEARIVARKQDFLVIVGVEILTDEGDLLVFGLDEVPRHKMPAEQLCELVNRRGGIALCAHPFRDNGRGMGEGMARLRDILSGVEAFNGNTSPDHNREAY